MTFKILFAAGSIVLVMGCAPNVSPQTYSVGSVGQVNRTISAKIISIREVSIASNSGVGGVAGAGAGAAAGSAIGGNNIRGNIIGAIGGAVIGGLSGSAIESSASQQKGIEYVVETENGNLMTIVQGNDQLFAIGQKVLVLYGSPSRLIADPRR